MAGDDLENVQRWTARRRVALVLSIIKGETSGLLYDALLGRPPRETDTDPIYELPRATPAAPTPEGKPSIEVDAEAMPETSRRDV